jgi:hypothetical protein
MGRVNLNVRFVISGTFAGLLGVIIALVLFTFAIYPRQIRHLIGPTPPPPTILAPQGMIPTDSVGLQEWVYPPEDEPYLAGSGFLLQINDELTVGVTTAHSLGDPQQISPATRIELRSPTQPQVALMERLDQALLGEPRTGDDLRVDFILLFHLTPHPTKLRLLPDPRGRAQEGERVVLVTGLGSQIRYLYGTVITSDEKGTWVLMDEWFNPALMSGAPCLSTYTGRVVGMAVTINLHKGWPIIGLHPVDSLVEKALGAEPKDR